MDLLNVSRGLNDFFKRHQVKILMIFSDRLIGLHNSQMTLPVIITHDNFFEAQQPIFYLK